MLASETFMFCHMVYIHVETSVVLHFIKISYVCHTSSRVLRRYQPLRQLTQPYFSLLKQQYHKNNSAINDNHEKFNF